tara:strand:- start:81 stop:521 length:441 start_codon:yes stop_codon:yes gene_type:complete
MAKKVKIKSNSVKYYEGDKVVVKTKSWNSEEFKLRVALVTNVRPAGKMPKRSYDVRTEDGSGLIMIGVDEPKSTQTILSSVTDAWISNGGTNNMFIHKKHGHTRGNYSDKTRLRADGEDMNSGDLMVGQFEKYNDFVFPCQGPRSF